MMDSPGLNLLLFAAAVVVAVVLFSPRFGLIRLLRTRREQRDRVRLEDALKHTYEHRRDGTAATLASLSNALRIAPWMALALAERMRRNGLVRVMDGRLLLTEQGQRYALQIIRAHRLWERYLADETGVAPLEWHALAEQQEHALTPEETEALSERLGYPQFDPHGDPIPTATGELPQETFVPLTQLSVGDTAQVVHVEDEPEVVYAQLVALGIHPGMELRVDAKSDERIIIKAEGRKLAIAPIVGGNVSIERIEAEETAAVNGVHETLSQLRLGEAAEVTRLSSACRGLERRRLMDLGILPGTRVEYDRRGLLGGLTAYRVRGTAIALREEQTDMIAIHRRERSAS